VSCSFVYCLSASFFWVGSDPVGTMEPDRGGVTADIDRDRDRERDRDYIQFFVDLGIEDDHKDVFLAGLLRNYHIAAAKLDKHLAGYSAAVHAAVSRLAPATGAHDAPEHLWIRVHDRLGFFHDEDRHAQRVVNVGMAFAYRHLEMNALAATNAQVLVDLGNTGDDPEALVNVVKVPPPTGDFVAPGGLVIGNPGKDHADGGGPLPGGGASRNGAGASASAASSGAKGASRTVVIGGDGGGASTAGGGDVNADEVMVPSATTLAGVLTASGTTATTGATPAAYVGHEGANLEHPGVVRIAAATLLRDTQPHVTPIGTALAAVKGVLTSVADREDIDDAVRQLMTDSLLFFARNHSTRRKVASSARGHMETSAASWAGLGDILDRWWAMWEAPPGVRVMAPDGTTAAIRNSGRSSRKSRWCYSVDMTGVNGVLQSIARRHTRYFKKANLPSVESVERIVEKDALPLTRCVAVMLLMGMMDAEYVRALIQLGSTGRGEHSKNAHISSATCQAFLSSGLATALPPIAPTPSPSAALVDEDDAEIPPDVDSFFAGNDDPSDELYAEVARAGERHAAVVAKDNRAVRKDKRQRPARRRALALAASSTTSLTTGRPPLPSPARRTDVDIPLTNPPPPTDAPSSVLSPPAKRPRLGEPQDGSVLHVVSWELPPSPEHNPSPPRQAGATDVNSSAADSLPSLSLVGGDPPPAR